jgi:hypothetical protein
MADAPKNANWPPGQDKARYHNKAKLSKLLRDTYPDENESDFELKVSHCKLNNSVHLTRLICA